MQSKGCEDTTAKGTTKELCPVFFTCCCSRSLHLNLLRQGGACEMERVQCTEQQREERAKDGRWRIGWLIHHWAQRGCGEGRGIYLLYDGRARVLARTGAKGFASFAWSVRGNV